MNMAKLNNLSFIKIARVTQMLLWLFTMYLLSIEFSTPVVRVLPMIMSIQIDYFFVPKKYRLQVSSSSESLFFPKISVGLEKVITLLIFVVMTGIIYSFAR